MFGLQLIILSSAHISALYLLFQPFKFFYKFRLGFRSFQIFQLQTFIIQKAWLPVIIIDILILILIMIWLLFILIIIVVMYVIRIEHF